MGVPKFFRWLSERYPLINQPIGESTLLPAFDNLYLDSNGIIHNATHGNEVSVCVWTLCPLSPAPRSLSPRCVRTHFSARRCHTHTRRVRERVCG